MCVIHYLANDIISGAITVPGGPTTGYPVELPIFGRRSTCSIFAILTGVFILASTTAREDAVSSEIFPARTGGTGNAILASANRIFGLIAPIMAIGASIYFEVWVPGRILVAAGYIPSLLSFEPRVCKMK
ncbi:hypothetical protein EDC04DRAFT_3092315, partial [Pisolithus marmoratus]